ncbi:Hsp70 family protein [Embleya sp. NBC_00896]|uniref:Hsp70 family protein n=1 Tax=Embleya sp. NBC_00896 TaxID=2975961 RepID=UPI0038644F4D|nr:Hsp70 family protein [Embleya sp. NBC_00896]
MSIVVGIDLGTTNSCIAIPADAEIPDKEALIAARRLRPVGDSLIVANPDRSPTTPSAVWIDPSGKAIVGLLAKNKARLPGAPPAMFFKRNMGTDQVVTAGHARITPLEASTHILRHLKQVAEETLGVPVERAIVTVPAFFETRAKNETTRAGQAAGLEVVETLIEPVAAALAYTHERARESSEPQTFLVYDLGGGTFDTSVVTWDPEVGFENRSFSGDRYLGGFDFDRRIVSWIATQLPEYDLAIDSEDPSDGKVEAQLLSVAEGAKHDLSRYPETEIVSQYCEDRRGTTMNIGLPMRREEFEDMIADRIRGTLDDCDRALARAGMTAADLDEIVMVGGSSRIPLVAAMLTEHFGRSPRLLNPDLCVALGAALKAANVPSRSGHLELDRPESLPPETDIGGRVLAGPKLPSPAGAQVVLTSDDGLVWLAETADGEGRFLFADVPLREGRENGFTVQVFVDGDEIEARQLLVEPDGKPRSDATGDVLAHDFSIELVDGLHVVVRAGTMVPYRTDFRLETASYGSSLRVGLVEGLVPIGEVSIRDLPADVPVGSTVEVTLEFEAGWTIRAEARLPRVGAEGSAVIDIPRREIPGWPELTERHRQVQNGWAEKRDAIPPADAIRLGPTLDRLLAEIADLVRDRIDPGKTHHKILEAETLVQGLRVATTAGSALNPPIGEFEDNLAFLARLADRLAEQDPAEAERFRGAIPGLRATGRAAHAAGNKMDWHLANEAVRDRINAAERMLHGGRSPQQFTAAEFQVAVLQEVEYIRRSIQEMDQASAGRHRGEAEDFLRELDTIAEDAAAVDVRDEAAGNRRLVEIYRGRIMPLRARADRWMEQIREGSPHIGLRLPKNSLEK